MISRHFRTLATLAGPLAAPVERIVGQWRGSTERAEIAYAGSPETAAFVANALLSPIERRETVGRLDTPLALRGREFEVACAGTDLAVVEVPPLWQSALPDDTQFRIPAWVSQEIRAAPGGVIGLSSALRKEVRRHRRCEGYTIEFSRREADIRRFYLELYRPYVAARFGAGAVVVDEARFLATGRGMQLALLRAGGERVAGLLFRQRGPALALGWFGSSSLPPRSGASEVLDALVIERAAADGVRRVILGHSRPSLADGVVRYKSRFGAVVRPTRFPQRVIGLAVRRPSAALGAAFNAAQFVSFAGAAQTICALRPGALASAGFPGSVPST